MIDRVTIEAANPCKSCGRTFRTRTARASSAQFCNHECYQADRWKNKSPTSSIPYKRMSVNGKNVLKHRWLMEQKLGRKLLPTEQVHHINEDKTDNSLDNLVVMTASEHAKLNHTNRSQIVLTQEQVYEARHIFAHTRQTHEEIAKRFNVSASVVCSAILGRGGYAAY